MVKSTGKRRYGHPALNGVLPEPWLPLKKGQTLVNSDRNGTRAHKDIGDQAVVLTLRKRYSVARSRLGRQQSQDGRRESNVAGPSSREVSNASASAQVDPTAVIDPWQDVRPDVRRTGSQTLSHRLSYDHASGVIMLPDHDWLEEEEDDSEEQDYGMENGLEQSVTESMINEETVPSPASASPAQPLSRLSRYGTYFHHPERRRQTVPGAFPVR